jgi:hypothetical protein
MRSHLSLAVLVGLLFCGLAAIEVPEFVQLTDDTSNDYTVIVSQSEASTVEDGQQSGVAAIATRSNAISSEYNRTPRSFHGAMHRSHDVLHLYCVQRT